jgi:hypothetical protein
MTELASSDATSPDWTSISHEVLCPLCEYNLRGLNTPRCPECGYPFEWTEILDQRRQNHPYLFEHHPEQNFKSFWQTAAGACRPRQFWISLHPGQRSRLWRLFLYWFLGAFCLLSASTVSIIALAGVEANARNESRKRSMQQVIITGWNNTSFRSTVPSMHG